MPDLGMVDSVSESEVEDDVESVEDPSGEDVVDESEEEDESEEASADASDSEEDVVDDDDSESEEDDEASGSESAEAGEASDSGSTAESSATETGDGDGDGSALPSSSAAAAAAAAATVAPPADTKPAEKTGKRKRLIEEDDTEQDDEPPRDPPADLYNANTTPQVPLGYYRVEMDDGVTIRLFAMSHRVCPETDAALMTPGPIQDTFLYALPDDIAVFVGLAQGTPKTELRFLDDGAFFRTRLKAKTKTRAHGLMVMPPEAIVRGLLSVHPDLDKEKTTSFLAKTKNTEDLLEILPNEVGNYGAPPIRRGPNIRTTGSAKDAKKSPPTPAASAGAGASAPRVKRRRKKARHLGLEDVVTDMLVNSQAVLWRQALQKAFSHPDATDMMRQIARDEIRNVLGKSRGKEEEDDASDSEE